ncbi:MAG: DNA-3-methyladenine glycosylase 2 family protein [Clostridiales bacterium]|nr:DNA-3-methyladenine glycosylase 2 family protein [Clostridiales bacterium]
MKIKKENNDLIVTDVKCFNLDLTLDCGQAFRWEKQSDGSFSGVSGGKFLNIKQIGDTLVFKNTDVDTYYTLWEHYFALDMDYVEICDRLRQDSLISKTIDDYYGIRVLNQDSWEALFSSVVTQQNNIKRIKGILSRICSKYGERVAENFYSFPSAERLSIVSEDEFVALGAGYRGKYLIRLAKDVAAGNIDLSKIKDMDIEAARSELLKIYGVGKKVADCALLFGFEFYDAFPIDVWMKRVMEYYPNGLPECFDSIKGIAQQYLFHWARNNL